MAQTIQIKRSPDNAAPAGASLAAGELAYTGGTLNKLFIGNPNTSNVTIDAIGGKAFTDKLDAATDNATGSTLVLRDASGGFSADDITANKLTVDNITLDGNDISTTNTDGGLTLTPNGTGDVTLYTDTVNITAANAESASILLSADGSDDDGDDWSMVAGVDNTLQFKNDISSAAVAHLTITPHATEVYSTAAFAGNITTGGSITATTGFWGNLTGSVSGNVTGSAGSVAYANLTGVVTTWNQDTSGSAATVSDAAQTSITSLGTLTGLNVAYSGSSPVFSLVNTSNSAADPTQLLMNRQPTDGVVEDGNAIASILAKGENDAEEPVTYGEILVTATDVSDGEEASKIEFKVMNGSGAPTTALTATAANVTIAGDLTVSGTTTTVNSTDLAISDNKITLNSGYAGNDAPNAGLTIERGTLTNVEIYWKEDSNDWVIETASDVVDSAAVVNTLLHSGNASAATFTISGGEY